MEEAYRRGVVEHLKGDGTFRGVAFHSLHAEYRATLGFLVVEIVLSVVGVLSVRCLGAEYVDGHTVNGCADIDRAEAVASLLVLMSLRWREQSEFLHRIIEQFGSACVE